MQGYPEWSILRHSGVYIVGIAFAAWVFLRIAPTTPFEWSDGHRMLVLFGLVALGFALGWLVSALDVPTYLVLGIGKLALGIVRALVWPVHAVKRMAKKGRPRPRTSGTPGKHRLDKNQGRKWSR